MADHCSTNPDPGPEPETDPLLTIAALGSTDPNVRELRRHILGGMQQERDYAERCEDMARAARRPDSDGFRALADLHDECSRVWGAALRRFDDAVDGAGVKR